MRLGSDDEFGAWIEGLGWKLVDGFKEECGHQLVWADAASSTKVNLVTNSDLKVRHLLLSGENAEEYAAEWSKDEKLVWPTEAILSTPFHAKDDEAKARAVHWQAASAPLTFDEEYYKVFSGMFGWPNAWFRSQVMLALSLPEISFLLKKVAEQEEDEDVLKKCPHCPGHMRMVSAITDPASIKTYLNGVGSHQTLPT